MPEQPFVYFAEKLLKVPPTCHITWDHIDYSVPHRLIASTVVVQASRAKIEIFHDGKLIAMHPRRWNGTQPVTDLEHMPDNHLAWRAKETGDLVLWAKDYSAPVQQIAEAEMARDLGGNAKLQQFEVFTRLPRTFGRVAFEQACARACEVGARQIAHVRNLLKTRRQDLPVGGTALPELFSSTENVRGADYYAERHHA